MNSITTDFHRCKECLYCLHFCPNGVLEAGQANNKQGYYPPHACHLEQCIACAICARMCPEAAITILKEA